LWRLCRPRNDVGIGPDHIGQAVAARIGIGTARYDQVIRRPAFGSSCDGEAALIIFRS
jgi:hypothetical protein